MRYARVVPGALTLSNLLCGAFAIGLVAVGAPLWQAAAFVGLGLLFDLLDGRAARALGTDGDFGTQLDSLADVVSFGVAPAITLYAWKLHAAGWLGLVGAAAIVAAAATRLARFNVTESAPGRFTGLAVTISAAIALAAVAADLPIAPGAAALGALCLAALMVSRFQYRNFKDRSIVHLAIPVVAFVGLAVVLVGEPVAGVGLAVAGGGVLYALSAPLSALRRRVSSPV